MFSFGALDSVDRRAYTEELSVLQYNILIGNHAKKYEF